MLTDTGDVFTCGYNDSGQCGVGTTGRVPALRRVETFHNKNIVSVNSSNGCEHLMCLDDDGHVYSCGYNARGQLGHGNKQQVTLPTLVQGLFDAAVTRSILAIAMDPYMQPRCKRTNDRSETVVYSRCWWHSIFDNCCLHILDCSAFV